MAICVRRTHTPENKAPVAVAAIRDDEMKTQLCEEFDPHANQISEWKRQLIEHASAAFDGGAIEPVVDLIPLQAKIVRLTLEDDFLEHASALTGLLSARR
jgi:transposase